MGIMGTADTLSEDKPCILNSYGSCLADCMNAFDQSQALTDNQDMTKLPNI